MALRLKRVRRSYDVKYLAAAEEKVEFINKELPEVILDEYAEIKPYWSHDWDYSCYTYTTNRHNSEYKISNKRAEDIITAYSEDLKTVGIEFFDDERENNTKNIYLGKSVRIGQTVFENEEGISEYNDYKDYNLYIHNYKIYPNVASVVNSLVKDEDLSRTYIDEKQIEHYIIYYK